MQRPISNEKPTWLTKLIETREGLGQPEPQKAETIDGEPGVHTFHDKAFVAQKV